MKRLAFTVTFLVGTVGIFHWLSQGFSSAWEPAIRQYLETSASRLTQKSVHIDAITPSFFHRVRLVNVLVTEPDNPSQIIFRAGEIDLTISLIDLPRAILRRQAYQAIGLISVKDPWLRLSKDLLTARMRHSPPTATSVLPVWFTLVWEGGTFQWLDSQAPHGAWTLYQTRGVYRIRGPQVTFAMRGGLQQAQSFRLQYGGLGKRWNAQVAVSEADLKSVISLAQARLKKTLLPKGWTARGRFHLEAHASGQRRPAPGEDWMHFLNDAHLTFVPGPATKPEIPSLGLSGTLTYKNGKVTGPAFGIDCPWFQGAGAVDIDLQRLTPHPDISVQANFPSGRLGRWPFNDAIIHTRYLNEHWEFLENSFRILDGKVSAKGYASAAGSNVAITAENMSLTDVGQSRSTSTIEGRLNASCSFKGPIEQWQMAGAWWLTDLQWGPSAIGDARGDFEIAPDHFQAQAKSENGRFRFVTEGTLSPVAVSIDSLELYLPTGATLIGEGRINRTDDHIRGTLDAAALSIPGDLPFLPLERLMLKGPIDTHLRISGTLADPAIKGNMQSAGLTFENEPLGKTAGTFSWTKQQVEIPSFHIDPGVDVRYMDGQGSLKIKDSKIGKWQVHQSDLHFNLEAGGVSIPRFSLTTDDLTLQWEGNAAWEIGARPIKTIVLRGKGEVSSQADPGAWDIPFTLSGRLESENQTWRGQTQLRALRPLMRKKPVDPFETELQWNDGKLTWTDAHWGKRWTSNGSAQWTHGTPILNARIAADHVPIEDWQPLLWPKAKDVIHGVLSGTLDLTGTPEDPQGAVALHLEKGRWRAFEFDTMVDGLWSHQGIKPLTLKGRFKTGGDFQFSGQLTPDFQSQGTVKLNAFNLQPLGESLGFPKSLDGSVTATLTLSGPLSHLVSSGHLEGGPVIYGKTSDHPFKLEDIVMDMTLAPSDTDPSVAHLTITEAQAKTAEELIRFQTGSYVEFAGLKPARLKLGTEIRNLHLGIFTLFGGLDLDGTWQIKPEGFAIEAKAQTRSLFINDYELEEGLVLIDYYNGFLKFPRPPNTPALVTGSIDFHRAPQLKFTDFYISGKDQQGLQLSGDIGPSLWDFQMTGRGLDMGILGELSGFPYPLSGAANVHVRGTGDPKHPHVDGTVDLDRGTALGLAFRSGSAAFSWQDARITFTKLYLTDPGHYNLEAAGIFPLVSKDKTLEKNHDIDFSIRLRDSNLSLLQSLSKEIKDAKGPVEGLVQIKGTLEDPSFHGSIRVTNGDIVGAHYFRRLRNASLSIDLDGDSIIVRDIRGKSGDGEFRGSGTITLAGFQPSKYDLKMDITSAKGLEVQVPELAIPESPLAKRFHFLTTASRCDVRGSVALHGPAEAPVFSGVGIISNGHFTFPPSRKNPPSLAIQEWFRRLTWDVELKFLDGAWFDNELVGANVAGTLKLKGPSDNLRVDGGLDISEGKISYLGLQFDLQQARYDVRSETSGDKVINTPYMRGVAECQIQAVDTVSGVAGTSGGSRLSVNDVITLTIDYAPVDQIKPRLTSASNPTMSQDKLLARVTQTDTENLTPQERNYLYQKQMISLIDNSLTTPLAQNVLKKAGIADRVRVQHVADPNQVTAQDLNSAAAAQQQSGAASLFANTKYTFEKDLSNRLSLGYGIKFVPSTSVDPDIQQQQKLDLVSDVQLSYRWFKNIYLRGDFDLPSSNPNILPERKVTIEPRWRFGWWGNTNKEKEKTPAK